MRILLDECLPEDLKGWLGDWDVTTVREMGWAGMSNGELLRRAEEQFDLFVTADRRLRYQQNLSGRRLAILVLPTNRLRVLRGMISEIQAALVATAEGRASSYQELPMPEQ